MILRGDITPLRPLLTLFVIGIGGMILSGCGGSSNTPIKGYTAEMLAGKRVAVVIGERDDVTLRNAEAFGFSRGVSVAGAQEMAHEEVERLLAAALDAQLDSNTVLHYATLGSAASNPLSAHSEFSATAPVDWSKVQRAGREGNIDYFIVLQDLTFDNSLPTGSGRGRESLSARYLLLDVTRRASMTSGSVDVTVGDPRTPETTYEQFARALTSKLPFYVAR